MIVTKPSVSQTVSFTEQALEKYCLHEAILPRAQEALEVSMAEHEGWVLAHEPS